MLSDGAWEDALRLLQNHVPRGDPVPENVPALQVWKQSIKSPRPNTSRGACGFSQKEL